MNLPLARISLLILPLTFPLSSALAAAERPNILLAISDDQSHPHASAYGCEWVRTPAFDRVSRSGVLFTRGFVASPGCSPSRAALLTGRYPWRLEHAGTHGSEFPAKFAVFPDLLEASGYVVGYTGKGWGPGNWQASGRSRNPAGNEYKGMRLDERPTSGINAIDYAANFAAFLRERPDGAPFCFWYGGKEPHRVFQAGSGRSAGKELADVDVPPFLPDSDEIRSDLLDYALEIEWFDAQLGRMLDALDKADELDNTLVIVTSDNGMAFPRAKANCYEYGFHVPLAMSWPAHVPGNRTIDDLTSLVDVTATILDVAGVEHPDARKSGRALDGHSLCATLTGDAEGTVDLERRHIFAARERHSSSRYANRGYPQRAVRSDEYLYIRNFHPGRWPAGAPQKYDSPGQLGPMHGAYHDIDASPSLTFLVEHRDDARWSRYFHWAVDKRPAEELYRIANDPGCLDNLAASPAQTEVLQAHRRVLTEYLTATGDPRASPGETDEVFETYKRFANIRDFPPPEEASN